MDVHENHEPEEVLEVYEPADGQLCHEQAAHHAMDWDNVLVPFRRELFEFLIPPSCEKGRNEGDRTLTLWWAKDRWKLCLRSKDGKCVSFFTGDTIGELFFDVQLRLRREACAWKEEKRPPKQGG